MLEANTLVFRFEDRRDAYFAFDTLLELGYQPVFHPDEAEPMLHIHIEKNDLTSALEIAQAHGGELVDEPAGKQYATFQSAYEMGEEIAIPAHMVTEDMNETYMAGLEQKEDEDENELDYAGLAEEEALNAFSADRM
ncbi:DNA/RNA helicase [Marinicrinis sediminis]|uniref:DNA/RNA helicase n=1 Tax=Marinicrinis sediminis TaxID=1652465 RepID=A0ABW5RHQ8_9BACL